MRPAAQDKSITAKLEFFVSVAAVLKPYLETFQSDAPCLPFITSELQIMLETLRGKFVKTQGLEAADTLLKISKVNVLAIENHVAASDIDIGFAAAATVSKALKEKISQLQALEFRKECSTMLAVIVSKIQERSPLQFHFARKLQSLHPRVIMSKPESVVKMFQQFYKTLVEEKWKTNQQADSELAQFRKLISEAKKYHYERFAIYSFTQERLDKFFSKLLEN